MPLGRVISAGMFTMAAESSNAMQVLLSICVMKPFSAPAVFTHCLHAPFTPVL